MKAKGNRPARTPGAGAIIARVLAFAALDILWLIQLKGTDAYFSVYLLCGLAGLLAAFDNLASGRAAHGRERAAAVVAGLLFTMAVVLANSGLFVNAGGIHEIVGILTGKPVVDPKLGDDWINELARMVNAPFAALGGYLVARETMVCAMARVRRWNARREVSVREHPGMVFGGAALAIAVIDAAYLWLACYPGILTTDSFWQMSETISGVYTNHHPFWHTMLIKFCMDVGMWVTGDVNAAVAFYSAAQILFMACAFGFALMTLYQAGVPKGILWIAFAVYALSPYNIAYSITMWKDVLFGGAVLFFVCALYRIIRRIGHAWLNYAVYAIGALGFALWRSNGWPALAATALFILITLRRKHARLLVLTALLLAATFVMQIPLLNWMGVEQPDVVEMLSVPEQQLARVVWEERHLEPELRDIYRQVFDVRDMVQSYTEWSADPIKANIRDNGLDYVKTHLGLLARLWLHLAGRYPGTFMRAWVEETKGFWNAGYDYWIMRNEVRENGQGVVRTVHSRIAERVFMAAFKAYEKLPLLDALHSIGLHVWLLAASLIGCIARRRKEYLLALPALMIVVTLMLTTPVFCEFRYAYAVFTTLPVCLCLPWLAARKRRQGEGER